MIDKIFMPDSGNSMKKTYIWTVLAGLTYAGSSFVMSMAVSNILGAYAAGLLALALSIGNQLLTVGYYNIRTFQVSDVSERYSFHDYLALRILTVGMMFAVGAVWIAVGGYTDIKLTVIVLMILFKAGEAVSDLFEGRYQQKGRYDISCRGVFFKTMLYLVSFILVMVITRSLVWALAVLTGLYLLSIAVVDSSLIKHFGRIKIQFNWKNQIELLTSCLPLFINSFLTTYILNASKYSIDTYYGESALGTFNVLYMMAFVVNLFASFVLKPLISPLSIRYNQGDLKKFVSIMKRQLLMIGGITIICVLGAYLLGIPVLSWVSGIDLSNYRGALCIILIGGAFTAVYQLLQYGIIIMRHQFSCLAGCIITALLTFLFTPILVKRYEIYGAAVSYLCSMVLMSVIFFVFVVYYLKKYDKDKQNGGRKES